MARPQSRAGTGLSSTVEYCSDNHLKQAKADDPATRWARHRNKELDATKK